MSDDTIRNRGWNSLMADGDESRSSHERLRPSSETIAALSRILHFATGGCDMDAKTRLKCIARECEASIAKATAPAPAPAPAPT